MVLCFYYLNRAKRQVNQQRNLISKGIIVFKNTSVMVLMRTRLSGCVQVNNSLKSSASMLVSATDTLNSLLQITNQTIAQICVEAKHNHQQRSLLLD
jgi:hypothetical protein